MFKKIINILGYVVIISQLFSIYNPILNTVVAGYTIKYIIYYTFIFISLGRWFIKLISMKTIRISDFLLCIFIVCPFAIGILMGWGIRTVFLESVLFIMPIAVYAWSQISLINKKTCMNIFLIINFLGGIISVLVALRLLKTDIWAADGQLVRAAGAVDSTLFIGGLIASLVLIYVFPENEHKDTKWLSLTAFISSIIGLLFSQSRSRLVIAFIIIAIIFIFNFFNKLSMHGNFKMIILSAIVLLLIANFAPNVMSQILVQIQERFSTLRDINVIYRGDESSKQIQAFFTSPLFGLGWGSRSQYSGMYAHNIYTTLLMQCGIVFTACFITWFCNFIRRCIHIYNYNSKQYDIAISIMFLIILSVLGFSNAGIVQSGGYFMMLYVYLCYKDRIIVPKTHKEGLL
ncbi:MAG: hypothetical protein K0S47_3847 [Herbinix sp.]|jgi:O-antigen ligase|nr:hypothetical protein [Herbinix sp.]